MSDPFSIAGSAVGVVSLGLTVCQSVVQYYSAYKGQEHEIDEMLEKTSSLADILTLLKPSLNRYKTAHPRAVDQLTSCLVSFDRAVAKLKALINKCEHAATSDTFRRKVRTLARKSLYPFRQETLHAWRNSVSECQKNINIAIGVLQLEIHDTTNSTISAFAVTNEALVRNQQLLLCRFEEVQHSIMTLQALPFTAGTSVAQTNSLNYVRKLVPPDFQDLPPPTSVVPFQKGISFCSCRPYVRARQSRLRFRSIVMIWTSKEVSYHRVHCPYSTPSAVSYQCGAELPVSISVRKWTVRAALNFNQALGAFSITPTLSFRAVVPDDSPAFARLSVAWKSRSISEFDKAFQSLVRAFQEGIASPTDMNESGQTLLHKAAHDLRSLPETIVGEELIQICGKYQKMVIGLIALGVPADPIDDRGICITDAYYSLTLVERFHEMLPPENTQDLFHFGDQVVERLEFDFSKLSDMLLDMVAKEYRSPGSEKIRLVSFIVEFQRSSSSFAEDMECSKLSRAVLRRSLRDVEETVKRNPGTLYERNILQQTPLHFAAGWPAGMEALLSHCADHEIVNAGDAVGLLPLEYACWYPCLCSVQLLLGADNQITKRASCFAYRHAKPSILREVAFGIAARRDRLRKRAQDVLPPEMYRYLLLPSDGPLDNRRAQDLESELHAYAGFVPQSLRTTCPFPYEEDDIADGRYINLPAATILYDAGFSFHLGKLSEQFARFAADDPEAHFQIEHSELLDALAWVLQTQFFVQPLYRMAVLMEKYAPNSSDDTGINASHTAHLEMFGVLWYTFVEQHLTAQNCPCFPSGCLSYLFSEDQSPEMGLSAPHRALEDYYGYRHLLVPRVMSAFAFDALGLSHSANCYWTYWANHDIIQAKQKEEQQLLPKFNTLVERLSAEYERLGVPLSAFLSEDDCAWRVVGEVQGEVDAAEQSVEPAN